jgi:hypothetical protein
MDAKVFVYTHSEKSFAGMRRGTYACVCVLKLVPCKIDRTRACTYLWQKHEVVDGDMLGRGHVAAAAHL